MDFVDWLAGTTSFSMAVQFPSAPYPEPEGDEVAELMMWTLEKIRPRLQLGGP